MNIFLVYYRNVRVNGIDRWSIAWALAYRRIITSKGIWNFLEFSQGTGPTPHRGRARQSENACRMIAGVNDLSGPMHTSSFRASADEDVEAHSLIFNSPPVK